ncbi:uncharacterized protein LOC124414977 isoform X2 [Diprion similis]|uniref:uncharacterized protein LOC124414977 isoform X2 n=1 Tax=Diprion similis TaxID=362088 RepID=UPI001EF9AE40|nr:uncharacterized protein LOC124414977 isoform X2 [Diprion similis]
MIRGQSSSMAPAAVAVFVICLFVESFSAPNGCIRCVTSNTRDAYQTNSGYDWVNSNKLSQRSENLEDLTQTVESELAGSHNQLAFDNTRPGNWTDVNQYRTADGHGRVYEEQGQRVQGPSRVRYYKKNSTSSYSSGNLDGVEAPSLSRFESENIGYGSGSTARYSFGREQNSAYDQSAIRENSYASQGPLHSANPLTSSNERLESHRRRVFSSQFGENDYGLNSQSTQQGLSEQERLRPRNWTTANTYRTDGGNGRVYEERGQIVTGPRQVRFYKKNYTSTYSSGDGFPHVIPESDGATNFEKQEQQLQREINLIGSEVYQPGHRPSNSYYAQQPSGNYGQTSHTVDGTNVRQVSRTGTHGSRYYNNLGLDSQQTQHRAVDSESQRLLQTESSSNGQIESGNQRGQTYGYMTGSYDNTNGYGTEGVRRTIYPQSNIRQTQRHYLSRSELEEYMRNYGSQGRNQGPLSTGDLNREQQTQHSVSHNARIRPGQLRHYDQFQTTSSQSSSQYPNIDRRFLQADENGATQQIHGVSQDQTVSNNYNRNYRIQSGTLSTQGIDLGQLAHGPDCTDTAHGHTLYQQSQYRTQYRRNTKPEDFGQQTQQVNQHTEDLTQQTEDLTQQTEDLTQQTQDLTQQTEDLTQQTEDLTQQTQDLTQQTEDFNQQSQGVIQQSGDLTQQTQDLTQQTEDFSQQSQGIIQQSGDLTQQTQDLTQQTEDLTQHTEDLTQQTQDLTQQTEDLTQQTEDLTQQTEDFSQQSQGVIQQSGDLTQQTQDLTQQTEDLTQHTEDLTQQTQDLTQQTEDLTQQTEDLTQQTEDFSQQSQGVIQQSGDLTQQTEDLTQQTEDLTQQTQDLTQQTQDLTQQTEDFNQQSQGVIQQSGDLTQQTQDLTQQTEDFSQQSQGVIQQLGDLTQQTQGFTQQTEDLTQKTQDLTQQTEDLTQQTQDLTQQTEDFSQQSQSVIEQSADLTQQTEDLTQQAQDLTQQIRDFRELPQQTQGYIQQLQDLTQETEDLPQRTEGFIVESGNLAQQAEDLTQQTEDFTQQTEDLTQQTVDMTHSLQPESGNFIDVGEPNYVPHVSNFKDLHQSFFDREKQDNSRQQREKFSPQEKDLTQQTQDLNQETQGLTQETEDLSQQITGGNADFGQQSNWGFDRFQIGDQQVEDPNQRTQGLTQEPEDPSQQITDGNADFGQQSNWGFDRFQVGGPQVEDLNQKTQGLTQETEDPSQQITGGNADFGQQSNWGFDRFQVGGPQVEDLNQKTQGLTQETEDPSQQITGGNADFGQQSNWGFDRFQVGGPQVEDLSQKTQGLTQETEDPSQQITGGNADFGQQSNWGFDRFQVGGPQVEDLSQKTQGLTQETEDPSQQITGGNADFGQQSNWGFDRFQIGDQQVDDFSQQSTSNSEIYNGNLNQFRQEPVLGYPSQVGIQPAPKPKPKRPKHRNSYPTQEFSTEQEQPVTDNVQKSATEIRVSATSNRGDQPSYDTITDTELYDRDELHRVQPTKTGGRRRNGYYGVQRKPQVNQRQHGDDSLVEHVLNEVTTSQEPTLRYTHINQLQVKNQQNSGDSNANPENVQPIPQIESRFVEAYGANGPYNTDHDPDLFDAVTPNPSTRLPPLIDDKPPFDVIWSSIVPKIFTSTAAPPTTPEPATTTTEVSIPTTTEPPISTTTTPDLPTTTAAPSFWRRFGNRVSNTIEKAKERARSFFG